MAARPGMQIKVDPMVPKRSRPFRKLFVVSEQRATFACGDNLDRVKAQGRNVLQGSDVPTAIGSAERMRCVRDNSQIVRGRNVVKFVMVAWVPREIDCDD